MSDSPAGVLAVEPSLDREGPSARVESTKSTRARMPLIVLCIVVGVYLFLVVRGLVHIRSATGTFIYPLDDTYIAMTLAKNLALHGVMGISPSRYVSATSSPGFLLLLAAAYRVTGPTVWWPLALSMTFGLLALLVAWRFLSATHWAIQLVALLAFIYFTPLHIMGLLGMEHTLHLALVLAFLHLAGKSLAERANPSWGLLLLAASAVSVRYESLFMVAVACLLFAIQRQIGAAIRLGVAAFVPVAMYSAVSLFSGSYWLPQSIAMKGFSASAPSRVPVELWEHFKMNLDQAPYIGALACVIVTLWVMPNIRASRRVRSILAMVFGGMVLHLLLARVGWVYRYEAYLVGAAIVVVSYAIPNARMQRNWLAALGALGFAAAAVWWLIPRTADAEFTLPYRSVALYCQQIQMARFLRRFEKGVSVAANDIGAISYFADIDCLDLVGLGDRDVFWLKQKGIYSTEAMAKLAAERGVKIAIVYDWWFQADPVTEPEANRIGGPPLPLSWTRVARWKTPNAVFLGGDTVSFYVTSPGDAAELKAALTSFAHSLPSAVQVQYE